MTDILDLIDAAVADYEAGPDAVRYNGPTPPPPPFSGLGATMAQVADSIRAMGAAFADTVARMQSFTPELPPPAASEAFRHQLMVLTTSAFRIRPHHLGVHTTCFCHPAPFPAARDYRRRTKHRNQRRRQ